MYIVLLGAPGAGKGTQAAVLANHLGVPHVASGDLFRKHGEANTPLGLLAKSHMERGELVPDDVTIAMIKERLLEPDCGAGAILDGFPRTLEQAKALDDALSGMGERLHQVVYIRVGEEELLRRLAGRWICRVCQTPYHEVNNPPKVAGICDRCGGELYQRSDDSRETAKKRLEVYFRQTWPLLDYYRRVGLLVEVDGEQEVEKVGQDLFKATRRVYSTGDN